jgi:arginine vasopressin receptor 1A
MEAETLLNDVNITSNENISATNFIRDEILARFEMATLILIFITATVGNSSVLIALFYRGAKLTRMYFYILHLSIADLVTAFFNVIPQLAWEITYRFKGGDELCRIIKFLQLLGPYLSSFILVLTAVDRFYAVCSPFSYCTWPAQRAKTLVFGAWVLALLCCLPQVVIFSYQPITPGGDVFDCWATFPANWGAQAYVSWYAMSVFVAPLIILIITYSCICRAIWRNYNGKKLSSDGCITKNSNIQPRVHSVRGISRAKIKTVKLTVVVIACYIVCSTPFISAQLWSTWDPMAMHSPFWSGTLLLFISSFSKFSFMLVKFIFQKLFRSLC